MSLRYFRRLISVRTHVSPDVHVLTIAGNGPLTLHCSILSQPRDAEYVVSDYGGYVQRMGGEGIGNERKISIVRYAACEYLKGC